MMKLNSKLNWLALFFVSLGMVACEEENESSELAATDEEQFQIYQRVATIWQDVDSQTSTAYEDNAGGRISSRTKSCVSLVLDGIGTNDDIPGFSGYSNYSFLELDYTSSDCSDSYIESGSITIYFAGLFEQNWKDSIVIDDLTFNNGTVVDGYRVSQFLGELSNSTSHVFDVLTDGTVSVPGFSTYAWNYDERVVSDNPSTTDFNYTSGGLATLTDLENNYTIFAESVSPLVFENNCKIDNTHPAVSGLLAFSDNRNVIDFRIDYGDGSCDTDALYIDANGGTLEIEI